MDRLPRPVKPSVRAASVVVGALILATGVLAPASAAPPAEGYRTTLLSMDPSVTGNPINRSGLVAGSINGGGERAISTAVVYDPRTRAVRPVPGPLGQFNRASDLSQRGVVSGWSQQTSTDGPRLAWVWRPGAATRQVLGPVTATVSSSANAVNDSGVVAGYQSRAGASTVPRAVIWDTRLRPAKRQELGTLGGSTSEALSINSAGYVVGSSTNARGFTRPFVWLPERNLMADLGPLPGYDSGIARDINDGSYVVGEMFNRANPDDTRAFLWSPVTHKITPLGPSDAQSAAYAINYHGLPVGRSDNYAVIWHSCRTAVTVLPGVLGLGINRTESIVGVTYADSEVGTPYLDGAVFRKAGPCRAASSS